MLFSEDSHKLARIVSSIIISTMAVCIMALSAMFVLSDYLSSPDNLPTASADTFTPAAKADTSLSAMDSKSVYPIREYQARHYHPYVKPKPKVVPPPPSAPPPPEPMPVQPAGSYQSYAMSLFSAYGWSSSEFSCLNNLWTRESGWNPQAANPYSGAFGIPQALPGSKMATAGADWATDGDTQVRWGLGYIKSTYGSPCGAWGHELATGAY